ncbi:MAG: hypothetical protein WKG07_00600 [Hymenobacter sp.]
MPGAVATLWLLGRAGRRGAASDALLALLIALPTLSVSQWMLGYAGWFDSHDGYSTVMFYVPWQLSLLMGPGYYLYFRSLTNQEFRLGPRGWRHLLPGLAQVALFAGVALLDLGWRRGLRHEALPDFSVPRGRRYLARWPVCAPRLARRGAAGSLRPADAGRLPPLRPLPRRQLFGPRAPALCRAAAAAGAASPGAGAGAGWHAAQLPV